MWLNTPNDRVGDGFGTRYAWKDKMLPVIITANMVVDQSCAILSYGTWTEEPQ